MARRRQRLSAAWAKSSSKWSNAVKTACDCGRVHGSKMEAGVCVRMRQEAQESGLMLFQQVRIPIWSLAAKDKGTASYISIDFVFSDGHKIVRAVDAKDPGRVSRDWTRGAQAFEFCYGIKIEYQQ